MLGERVVTLDRMPFTIGRRETNDLRLGGSEVSREHAEIVADGGALPAARQGVAVRHLRQRRARHRVRAAARRPDAPRAAAAAPTWCSSPRGDDKSLTGGRSTTGARDDLRQITALLEGFRALGSGRVLQDVLALVLDAAIEISGAERAFIMLSTPDGTLEFKLARGRDKQTLTDSTFAISRKIPGGCVPLGPDEGRRRPARRRPGRRARRARSPSASATSCACRSTSCRYVESGEARGEDRRIGVLYLDSREKGTLLSDDHAVGARDARGRSLGRDRERAPLPRQNREGADGTGDAHRGRDPAGPAAQAARQPRLRRGGRRQHPVPIDRRRLLRLPRRTRRVRSGSRWATWRARGRRPRS